MKVISTNTGTPVLIHRNGEEVMTGLFKRQVNGPIFLGIEDVRGDHVIDRRYHGGNDKACYLYSAGHYNYWKQFYPDADWQWGMFGENLTVSDLDESLVRIGDVFRIGEAVVQVTQPRQPCFKLGIRFGSPEMVSRFAHSGYPGIYVRVLKEGFVKMGDSLELTDSDVHSHTINAVFNMLFNDGFSPDEYESAISNPFLAESCRKDLKKRIKRSPDE